MVETHATPQSQQEADKDATYLQQRAAFEDAHKLTVTTLGVGIIQTIALFLTVLTMAYVAVRQLRAYVFPGDITIEKFGVKNIEVHVQWKNAGKTPASHCETQGAVFFAAFPLPDKVIFTGKPLEPEDSGKHPKTIVYPGCELYSPFFSAESLTPQIIQELRAGQSAIYVTGTTYYRDVFRLSHKTQFCRYLPPQDVKTILDIWQKTNAERFEMKTRWMWTHILNAFT